RSVLRLIVTPQPSSARPLFTPSLHDALPISEFRCHPSPLGDRDRPTEVVQFHITGDQFSQHTDRQLHQLPRFVRGFDDGVERPILAYNFILIWKRNDFRLNTDKTNRFTITRFTLRD